ncbi:MAG TPA: flagellar biosynthesis regulator FlaF [Acetobacteraceae bacterium]|nr:flagellar biosynthesis regulator FlaF [Acetobacteraceae bacterium]
MQRGITEYRKPNSFPGTPRELEIMAFRYCNRLLTEAAEPIARITALSKNHELWSILVKDLALENNGLPEVLKQNLIALGQWSMRYAILAMARTELPMAPMVRVNSDMIEGLEAQALAMAGSRPNAAPATASLAAALSA